MCICSPKTPPSIYPSGYKYIEDFQDWSLMTERLRSKCFFFASGVKKYNFGFWGQNCHLVNQIYFSFLFLSSSRNGVSTNSIQNHVLHVQRNFFQTSAVICFFKRHFTHELSIWYSLFVKTLKSIPHCVDGLVPPPTLSGEHDGSAIGM